MTDVKGIAKALQVLPLPSDHAILRDILAPLRGDDDAPPRTDRVPPSDRLEHPRPD